MTSERMRLTALRLMVERGDRLGYNKKPEVQKYPVLGALGTVSQEQLETMTFHLDAMQPDEREQTVEALLNITETNVTATLAGMPLLPGTSRPDPERFPYLSQQSFYGPIPAPRYRKWREP